MAVITFEPLTPTLIENTTMKKGFRDGEFRQIFITPNEGYVLHDNNLDDYLWDEETQIPSTELTLGYKEGSISVRYDYDFTTNPDNIYAVPRDSVPADRIFGGANNDHEIA